MRLFFRTGWIVALFIFSSFARGEDLDRSPATVKQLRNSKGSPKSFVGIVKHPAWHYSEGSWEYLKPRRNAQGAVKLGPISSVQSGRTQAMGRPYYNEDNSNSDSR